MAVADHATQPATQKGAAMNDDVKAAIDEIANSLQVINRFSKECFETRLCNAQRADIKRRRALG